MGDFINEVSGVPRCVKVVRVFRDGEMLAAMVGVKVNVLLDEGCIGGCDRNVAGQGGCCGVVWRW